MTVTEQRTNTLRVLDPTGDTRQQWDPSNPSEVEAARQTFDALKAKGYMAFKVEPGGRKGEQIRQFDPDAGEIIMSAPLQGG